MDLFGLVEVMSEFPKFLIHFCCASVFMEYLCTQMRIDLLVMEQKFILLTLIEITLRSSQA